MPFFDTGVALGEIVWSKPFSRVLFPATDSWPKSVGGFSAVSLVKASPASSILFTAFSMMLTFVEAFPTFPILSAAFSIILSLPPGSIRFLGG